MYTDVQLDRALRALDPAHLDAHPEADPDSPRARADLEAILASEPTSSADPSEGRPRRRPPMRRVALVGAAAAVVVAAAIVAIPGLTSHNDDGAFATWAAVPQPLAPEQRPGAAEECRESYRDGPGDYAEYLESARAAVAERRGAWVTVVLSGADGFTATCVTNDSTGAAGGMIGTIGTSPATGPGAREVSPTSLGVGTVDNRELSMITGYAGGEIAGLTYSSEHHGEVMATVSRERFALWMPGDELRDAPREGVNVDVTYADGTRETVRLGF